MPSLRSLEEEEVRSEEAQQKQTMAIDRLQKLNAGLHCFFVGRSILNLDS